VEVIRAFIDDPPAHPTMVNIPATVSAACFDREVWIRIEGRGNFQSSGSIKKFAQAMIQRGHRNFVIDLAECEHMDSTFMGTLTGISQKLREQENGCLLAINVSPRNMELLENLGLTFLFDVEAAGSPPKIPAEVGAQLMNLPIDPVSDHDLILSAHEALVAANPVNADRFRDVLEYLKQGGGGTGR
jgi:anti-anti-sigma regulatory factor